MNEVYKLMSFYDNPNPFPFDIEKDEDEEQLWNLDVTISRFILPRLKAYRTTVKGYPATLESMDLWYEILDKMIIAMNICANEPFPLDTETDQKVKDGLDLFAKYFTNLWN